MPMTKDEILAEAKSLEPHEREELIDDLRQMGAEDLSPEQLAELRRRVEAMDRGEAEMIPGEQVMRELRDRLARR